MRSFALKNLGTE